MAGSSVPVAWRIPALELKTGTDVQEALAVSPGGLESYGFHALEMLQCLMERRQASINDVKIAESDRKFRGKRA